MKLFMVGAGGHARSVADAAVAAGNRIAAYAALSAADWLDAPRVAEEDADPDAYDGFVVGVGGVEAEGLRKRLALFEDFEARGFTPAWVIHPRSVVAADATLDRGVTVLAGAVVNPGATVGAAAILNTGAIVEHDVRVGAGAHVAPGAILLGGATVGDCAMIGAGAVVLPGAEVPDGTLVRALTRFPK